MKPRLKLRLDGALFVVQPVRYASWSAMQARDDVRRRYGSIDAFAAHIGVPYGVAAEALSNDLLSARRAGRVGYVRQILGLRSHPSAASLRLAAFHAARRVRDLSGGAA